MISFKKSLLSISLLQQFKKFILTSWDLFVFVQTGTLVFFFSSLLVYLTLKGKYLNSHRYDGTLCTCCRIESEQKAWR